MLQTHEQSDSANPTQVCATNTESVASIDMLEDFIVEALDEPLEAAQTTSIPVVLYPLTQGQIWEKSFFYEGVCRKFSSSVVRIEVDSRESLSASHLIVGFMISGTMSQFAVVVVRETQRLDDVLIIDGVFAEGPDDVLRNENFVPKWNPKAHRYTTQLPEAMLDTLCNIGVIRSYLVDRVIICPECLAVPTLRRGCRACGSANVTKCQLIHHFACAHVAPVDQFEQHGAMVCPKCRTKDLVIGTDYEYLDGPYRCLHCDWSDTDLELIGQCDVCQLRFAVQCALEEELIGYHVARLDPLAIRNAD